MFLKDVVSIVNGTADPAYAVDSCGNIAAWNAEAEAVFGITAKECLSKPCHEVIRGQDEDGMVCAGDCVVRRSARKGTGVRNYDLRIKTSEGRKWFNISIIVVAGRSAGPYVIHIARPTDVAKRLEMVVRDFIVSKTDISEDKAVALISSDRTAVRETKLTNREIGVLRSVADGSSTAEIAEELGISPSTVENHMQHVLEKLNVHSRLEAVLRAEHSGLLQSDE